MFLLLCSSLQGSCCLPRVAPACFLSSSSSSSGCLCCLCCPSPSQSRVWGAEVSQQPPGLFLPLVLLGLCLLWQHSCILLPARGKHPCVLPQPVQVQPRDHCSGRGFPVTLCDQTVLRGGGTPCIPGGSFGHWEKP